MSSRVAVILVTSGGSWSSFRSSKACYCANAVDSSSSGCWHSSGNMKGQQGGYIGRGWQPHKVILHFQYVQSLTKIRRGQVFSFGNIQLAGEPISNGQLHMKNHQSRAQAATIGMVELTFQMSSKSCIQLQEAPVSQHNGMCVAHQGTKKSTSAPELRSSLGGCNH
jgi:hypothetical protein